MAELPENKLTDFIKSSEKAEWRPVNNHNIDNFTENEIKRITNSYSTLIGEGSFGQVYKGALDNGTAVAVKRYTRQNLTEGFGKEIIVHCQINHRNVVRLLGYCTEDDALMIVTEYVSGGNLRDLLHGSDNPISLDERLCIAIECADALGYMHSSMYQPIIHGDIKPDNILLDSKLGAKLSDFGLSRLLSMDKTQYTMHVAGSRGYMDPEYIETGIVDPKSDVYSFGIVLLELITRSKASESGFSTGLKRNFTDALRKGKREAWKMFDSDIASKNNINILDGIGNLAAECFSKEMKERPEMKDVRERLQMLRRRHLEHPREKIGRKGISGETQDTTESVNKLGKSISSSSSNSTVPYKLSFLDIFSRKARRNFMSNGGEILHRLGINIFTNHELGKITRNYSTVVGHGSSGFVYMGWIDDNMSVVVKCSILVESAQEDYVNALAFAFLVRHPNIIRLVGCCLETDIPLLVYEFASGGSLHDVLHGKSRHPVSLGLRLDIARGSAEALAYLHSEHTKTHGNVKSTNILLDEHCIPKVSANSSRDFGRAAPNRGFVERDLEYMDPVCLKTGLLTQKSDVYSFGIVLLELITRKQARYGNNRSLQVEYISACKNVGNGRAMHDEEIAVGINMDILERMGMLAVMCVKEDVDERPTMSQVAEELHRTKNIWNERREEIAGDD